MEKDVVAAEHGKFYVVWTGKVYEGVSRIFQETTSSRYGPLTKEKAIEKAEALVNKYGGKAKLLEEIGQYGMSTPEYSWK